MTVGSTVGWGICSTGKIATGFARNLAEVPGARIAGVSSRAVETATAFAREHGDDATRSYASVEELAADPAVDVVYVASPHSLHDAHTRLALEAGKPVLCEKPMTLETSTTAALFDEASSRGLFLMEAMWMACHPTIRKLRALLADGEHGTPRQVHADIGFVVDPDPAGRLLDPALGAGALLDMGIYPLTFANLVLGEPDRLTAVANLSERGIDLDISIAGLFPRGATAALTATLTSHAAVTASVATEIGRFDLPRSFYSPSRIRWTSYWTSEGTSEWIEPDEPVIGQGYGNEIAEVHRCLRAGALTSELVPPAQTIALMRQMDDLRSQIGVSYGG
jgi:predicted dehydrogenase